MRHLPILLLLPVLSLPAWAADPPKPDAPPAPAAHQTWEQRFTGANLAHDGHLTPAEAKGGYADIARHFADIDVDHKGYVTENDIKAWKVKKKAARRLAKASSADNPQPQPAVQRTVPVSQQPPVPPRQTMTTSVAPKKP